MLLNCSGMEGKLPVRYLGVPLISNKLSSWDCEALLENISSRSNSWMAKHLSFAGRLQLLSSVLHIIQIYWLNISILPRKVIKAIDKKFNRFL
jgi:DNA integrity scanning protein DisA with diadenylate cyclase activity